MRRIRYESARNHHDLSSSSIVGTFCRSYAMTMIISHDREKLIEAVKFFALNTNMLGKTKLYKLLYFLDFTHFRDTGKPVTGLQYYAWPMGPVPVALHEEIPQPSHDLSEGCEFRNVPVGNGSMLTIRARGDFNASHFSKRELRIMAALANEFRNSTAEQMIERTHLENSPWHQIYEAEQRRQAPIPYQMSLRRQDIEQMLESIADRVEINQVLSE